MNAGGNPYRTKAFTLIEMLVVIAVIAALMAILVPSLNSAKNQGMGIVCQNNLRQLTLANESYAQDHRGYSVPGALDIDTQNLHRWYGTRPHKNTPFEPSKGPLASYLTAVQLQCPQKVSYSALPPDNKDFEQGNGGYGYNFTYLGSQIWRLGYETGSYRQSTPLHTIKRPQETLMFCDTAMVKRIDDRECMIMYPFAEPRFLVINQTPEAAWMPFPSLHFRHRKFVAIVWADGHSSTRQMGSCDQMNNDGTCSLRWNVGWFEPMDNTLFDLE